MKYLYLILMSFIIFAACKPSVPSKEDTREVFDAGNLQVISSFANRKAKTMSVLYGNQLALQAALSDYQTHQPGEHYTLVVYRQVGNKYWYGSYQNGKLLSAEHLKTISSPEGETLIQYNLEKGSPIKGKSGKVDTEQQRIEYIFTHRPSAFPN